MLNISCKDSVTSEEFFQRTQKLETRHGITEEKNPTNRAYTSARQIVEEGD